MPSMITQRIPNPIAIIIISPVCPIPPLNSSEIVGLCVEGEAVFLLVLIVVFNPLLVVDFVQLSLPAGHQNHLIQEYIQKKLILQWKRR